MGGGDAAVEFSRRAKPPEANSTQLGSSVFPPCLEVQVLPLQRLCKLAHHKGAFWRNISWYFTGTAKLEEWTPPKTLRFLPSVVVRCLIKSGPLSYLGRCALQNRCTHSDICFLSPFALLASDVTEIQMRWDFYFIFFFFTSLDLLFFFFLLLHFCIAQHSSEIIKAVSFQGHLQLNAAPAWPSTAMKTEIKVNWRHRVILCYLSDLHFLPICSNLLFVWEKNLLSFWKIRQISFEKEPVGFVWLDTLAGQRISRISTYQMI